MRFILALGIFLLISCHRVRTPFDYAAEALENFNKAEGYYKSGDFARAAQLYLKVTKIKNYWFLPFKRLGECFERLGRAKKAIAAYEGALSIDSKNEEVLTRLAELAYKNNLLEKALDAKRRLLLLRPKDHKLRKELDHLEKLLKQRSSSK